MTLLKPFDILVLLLLPATALSDNCPDINSYNVTMRTPDGAEVFRCAHIWQGRPAGWAAR